MFKKLWSALLITTISMMLVVPAFAAESQVVVSNGGTKTIHKADSKGFFWKLKKGDNIVYLLGSIHVASKDMYPLSSTVEKAFSISDKIVVEADIVHMDQEKFAAQTLEKGTYPEGETIQDHISPELYAKLTDFLKANGLPENGLDGLKPWLVQNVLSSLAVKEGYSEVPGIDSYFLSKAGKKPILELEGMDFQLNMLADVTSEFQEVLLRDMLVTPETEGAGSGIDVLASLWKKSDAKGLADLLKESAYVSEEAFLYNQYIFEDRNVGMEEKIRGYLNDGTGNTYFVIAGAGHFIGQDNIIQMLKKNGYTALRIH
ncbi:TraB/GumN family protein [Paenibacillus sp. IHBB 10380]|uniref:TraB/GumN family protein n=1 Tax=Paenibacillus sp. IHBB 10380 TaxID=1566358 RepID=UPI0006977526|nr:TraB/GumN family protein [Paenibacillus sp. IHBB 10380]